MLLTAVTLASAALVAATGRAAPAESNSAPGTVLLYDNLGRLVQVPTNKLPSGLLPPPEIGLGRQIPDPVQGSVTPGEVLQRSRQAQVGFQLFPPVPPPLMPYLASQDEYGNTAIRPGALIPVAPFEPIVQGGKYRLSEYGFRYSLDQTLTYVNMTDVKQGDNTLGFYTLDLKAKWAIYNAPDPGMAGWISTEVEAKSGINSAANTQSAGSNIGAIADPTEVWSSVNGVRVPELAWQQSFCTGKVVAVAGMVNQQNYLDRNVYAQSGRRQFLNSALINSGVMPLESYQPGFNLQWQPQDEWYGMLGGNAGDAKAGQAPWTDFSFNKWSLQWELGYAPHDLLGLGPGIYRIQPFVAESGGSTGGGLCFDFQQQLGEHSPFGWFGRFGFGGSGVSAGASAQIGTGLVWQGALKHLLLERTSNDLLGLGLVWSQPSATTKTVYHENECVLEAIYVMQLTPTIKLEPDLQTVWNAAFNRSSGPALVSQLQLVLSW